MVLYSLWCHHTETSEWSKITKIIKIIEIQFYKYEHMGVKFMYEFFWMWLLCITYYKLVNIKIR